MTDIDKALELARAVTKLAAGFPGHFFHDPECTDLVYIATDCEEQQCDCSVGEDCAVIVGACDGIDDVAEPLAQLLNAAGPLARALLALHTRVEAMAAVVEAAEGTADEMEHDVGIAERHRVVCREGGQHVGTGGQLGALPPSGLSAVRRYAQSLRAALSANRGAK